jgi:hypothetical protein
MRDLIPWIMLGLILGVLLFSVLVASFIAGYR